MSKKELIEATTNSNNAYDMNSVFEEYSILVSQKVGRKIQVPHTFCNGGIDDHSQIINNIKSIVEPLLEEKHKKKGKRS